jgi:hypothetical protein
VNGRGWTANQEYLFEVLGHMAEDAYRLGELAADEDDDELNRRVFRISEDVANAGKRLSELEQGDP